ncbi:MAG: glycosyltransferase family 2 protein [Deltaproteobacteria bacterium]|nr:MAG: glycosyltransferase family 2 protein [Deltaproteobacteria bacterium]
MEKLTVIVPTYNEEANIRDCLEGVKWADELIVVDSFSTDGTREIAREYTDKVREHEYINSATQKNWIIPQATYDWILIVDADERVTQELKEEILALLRDGPRFDGYYIRRLNHFLDKPIRHCGWERDKVLRLFRKGKGQYLNKWVHADIVIKGRVGQLKNPLLHYTFRSFDQYFEKFHRYSTWGAMELDKQGKVGRWYHILFNPPFRFFKMFVLQKGFLDGYRGLIVCFMSSFSVFLKYAKLWELRNRKKTRENA